MKYQLLAVQLLICSFLLAQKPVIDDFNPKKGNAGTAKVSIIGRGFHANKDSNIVFIGNIRADVKEAGSGYLIVAIPKGAGSRKFSVTVNGLTGYSRRSFSTIFEGANNISANSFVRASNDSTKIRTNYFRLNHADLDNDGKIDIVGTQMYFNSITTDPDHKSAVLIQQNLTDKGVVRFGEIQKYIAGNTLEEVAIADLDGDGKLDVVSSSVYTHTVHIFKNISDSGKIKLANSIDYLIDTSRGMPHNLGYNAFVSTADVNDDGKPDIIAGISIYAGFAVFINTSTRGKIEFNKPIIFSGLGKGGTSMNTGSPRSLVIADMNADNKPDILFCNTFPDKIIQVVLNNSTQDQVKFDSTVDISVPHGVYYNPIIAGDFTGDGLTDIMGANYFNEGVTFYRNTTVNDKLSFAKGLRVKNPKGLVMAFENLDGDTQPEYIQHNLYLPTQFSIMKHGSSNDSLIFSSRADINHPYDANAITTFDVDADGKQDIVFAASEFNPVVYLNKINSIALKSFSPKSAYPGDTITITGSNFLQTNPVVRFGDSLAKYVTVLNDSTIISVVAAGASGKVFVSNANSIDSLPGFVFKLPEISFTPSNKFFKVSAIPNQLSTVDKFQVLLKNSKSGALFKASKGFEVSIDSTKFYSDAFYIATSTQFPEFNTNIYVRAKADSVGLSSSGSLTVSGDGLTTQTFPIQKTGCDSSILKNAQVAGYSNVSSICLKDSIVLSAASNTGFYLWSNGDTTRTLKIIQPVNVSLRTATTQGCFGLPSPTIAVLRNLAATPVLTLTRDSVLSSTTASFYKWFLNNREIIGATINSYTAKRNGLYKVETSSNNICWDASNEVAILNLSTRSNSDSLVVRAYPNPSTGGNFTVLASLRNPTSVTARLLITDMGGTNVIQNTRFLFFGREIRIPVTITTKGTFVVRVEMNGEVKTVNVIVQ